GNTASHEFGHALSLHHFGGTNPQPSGLMQTPDAGLNRETWRTGLTHSGEDPQPPVLQDDMAIISNTNPDTGINNNFGYPPDDHGNSVAAATVLTAGGSGFRASGVIAELTDVDFFRV